MKRLFILLCVLTGLLLSACQFNNPYGPVPKQLALKVRVFEDVVRWRELQKMYAFGKGGEGWEIQQGLENIRVTGYESTQPSEIEPWRWGQTTVITYVLRDQQVVKRVLDQAVWASDDEGKSWYRVTPPPRF